MERKRWVILVVAGALGAGGSVAVGACGGDDRGSVEIETSTSGTGATTETTGAETAPGTTTAGAETTTTGAETAPSQTTTSP